MSISAFPKSPARLNCRDLNGAESLWSPATGVDVLVVPGVFNGLFRVGFAVSPEAVRRALRLRYQVFNEELGEGLMTSRSAGLDRDEFDDRMTHLLLLDRHDNAIGTYRMQTVESGIARGGLYCAREYDLDPIAHLFPSMIECGRACIAKPYRNFITIVMLWKGLDAFLELSGTRHLFGCCSLTTLDPYDGWRGMRQLRAMGAVDESLCRPMPEFSCGGDGLERDPSTSGDMKIPKLFRAYLRLGARVVSLPAIDREFGTVDFLVLLDRRRVSFSQFVAGRE